TGENVVEFHLHGSPVAAAALVRTLVEHGAREAGPGEFTRRAFLNGRMDLAQAEAVADLISSSSEQAARAAMRSLDGAFSRTVEALVESLTDLRMRIEAAIDFPEEEVDFLSDPEIRSRLGSLLEAFGPIRETARQGRLLGDGMTVVIAGVPNAGKSSLLNRLAGYEAAIVTHLPGTTRDVLREDIDVDGMPLHVVDTAGLREQADEIETEGIRRARAAMEKADRLLVVVDAATGEMPPADALPEGVPATVVRNKVDLTGEHPGLEEGTDDRPVLRVSAVTGAGLAALREHLKACVGFTGETGGTFSARRRHLEALSRAQRHAAEALHQLEEFAAGELAAEELRLAQEALGEITGRFTSEDLLGRIFASFCIGK
ncbi:MAG: tRNA uridine-5-carboxymethylaminomethyl(34) synthesis GTPase MnmE, partial [Anaerolineae bacterium]